MRDPERELTFWLAGPERRLLRAIARRVPGPVTSDHFTALGVLGATAAGMAYALSAQHVWWLWVATAALVLNWLGDSLDGTLARVRHHERPRYGYYLDHLVDAYATAAIGIGLGLSPFFSLSTAMGLVIVYLALSINVYLESTVFGAFRLGYGRIGPTELRLLLIAVNTALVFPTPLRLVANAVLAAAVVGMLVLLTVRFVRNVRELARLEPLPPAAVSFRTRALAEPRLQSTVNTLNTERLKLRRSAPAPAGTPRATSLA